MQPRKGCQYLAAKNGAHLPPAEVCSGCLDMRQVPRQVAAWKTLTKQPCPTSAWPKTSHVQDNTSLPIIPLNPTEEIHMLPHCLPQEVNTASAVSGRIPGKLIRRPSGTCFNGICSALHYLETNEPCTSDPSKKDKGWPTPGSPPASPLWSNKNTE